MKCSAALILLVSFSASALAASVPNRPGGPSWPSGVGQIQTPTGLNAWKAWTGYEPDVVVAWSNPASTWADFRTGRADIGQYFQAALKNLPKTTPIIHAYPMLPVEVSNRGCKNPEVWDRFAAGEFDANYREMARNMRALVQANGRDTSTIIIRLGWEMNGDWYPWSVCNKVAEFQKSWERATKIIREEMPGVTFDFSVTRNYAGYSAGRNYGGGPGVNLAAFLPSSDSYDYITRSTHDGRPETVDDASWSAGNYNPPASARLIGLVELRDTALAKGKKFGLSEWGTQFADCSENWKTASNPALFLRKVHDFLEANAKNIAWDAYFSVGCTQLQGRQETEAAKTYKELWGKGSSSPPPAAAPNPPQLIGVE